MIRPERKNIFNIHDPIGLRYLFQLRLSLSPLRSHKKQYGFIDTPTDKCLCTQGIENAIHFLFFCPFYDIQRIAFSASVGISLRKNMFDNLANNLELHLYGNKSISFDDNQKIILSTIAFIKATKRFST